MARLILPFFSTKYKTDVTIHCLLKALSTSVYSEDEHQLHSEESGSLLCRHPRNDDGWSSPEVKRQFRLDSFFSLYHAHFQRAAPLLFHNLRENVFKLSEEHYQNQFTKKLRPVDGLGFSGSLFFYTDDRSFIIKSIGRRFEYIFFYETLLEPLGKYYHETPDTLLSQVTDVLYSFEHRLGSYFGVSPSHYIVMTNVLGGLDKERGCKKWDLKPQNFFEPTRDLVPDELKTEAAKSGLADELDEKVVLSRRQKNQLMYLVEHDTEFLSKMETIDYSLLLGRYPIEMFHDKPDPHKHPDPLVIPERDDFVRGVRSPDGKWVYKMCILDFFWNVQQLHPKIIKVAGTALPEQTVTTEPTRYRKEFLRMLDEYIEVYEDQDSELSSSDSE